MAFHQCAERVTDAWAARWVHGFPGPLGLPDIRDTGKWRVHQGRMAGSLAASLNLPPRISSCDLNPGICHTACAAPERWVWCGMGKVTGQTCIHWVYPPLTQRPRYLEIRAVMEQIPEIHKESLDQFDCKLLNPSLQKAADKRRKDHFKRLIAGCIGVSHTSLLWLPAPHSCALSYTVVSEFKTN